ncbi:hypothetical protein D5F01_LYC13318 [Larimichthys crocea]|uniref:Uncharacterized protein n=1 Tax=Larimichthys crocea TaxID=215358 RepID=A0A6G0I766_LARCR|nr:hypothetical protein D5F01_LYC13318 [Larimichthys crocea]
MKLKDPVITFRSSRDTGLRAKSTADHRWYKVRGITKTLHSIARFRKGRSTRHNMISMDLYARVVKDLNTNPESLLEWVPEYIQNLNASGPFKGVALQEALLELFRSTALSPEACRRLWDRSRLSTVIGTTLEALRLTPICAGLKVASVPTPDRCSKPGAYTYHNNCTRGCTSIHPRWGCFTEVDLVAHDTVKNNIALLELKTRSSDILDRHTLWRYNTQLWLTWLMFSLTYPSMAERSAAYLVIIRPGQTRSPSGTV